jgi:spermidine synthase
MLKDKIKTHAQIVGAFRGLHVIAELYGVEPETLNDERFLINTMQKAIRKGGATVLNINSHKFSPSGVTVVALLAESHSSIHTYPQEEAAFLDVFTCGDCDPEAITDDIAKSLQAKKINCSVIRRGTEWSPTKNKNYVTVVEPISEGLNRTWQIDEILYDQKSEFQEIVIGKTSQGISLFCNGERQSTELSQQIYHEGQLIPAALMAEKIERVLIIGSSEGVISQMALKLGAKEVIHVDIDLECVQACAKYLPYGYSSEDLQRAMAGDSPIKLVHQDGFCYVEECIKRGDKFDIIVLDLPDEQAENAQQNRLYELEFTNKLKSILTDEGAYITQAGCTTFWRNETLIKSWNRIKQAFSTTVFFEMEEQDWAWIVGCKFSCEDPGSRMKRTLNRLAYVPEFIDEESISKSIILPISVRKREGN